ncbi:hypothetical protein Phum_PHUM609140 [Pediculus humanus corporis]|uniref:Uncharacterized protein n=1 Tax=Pediculus humanus subsp. corporis TaxID=121224 RepID=E0W3R7_PEDHC|nr:uncharacterized protein Phum_PHUM609140 [Pediculus humanus corporis]EEB20273.1 hypothetical protein Phum_PHUM609140 [Pediculus humanus corporis]
MMDKRIKKLLFTIIIVLSLWVCLSECKKKKKKETDKKPNETETNIFNFLRLFFFRMIYGFATMFGAQEDISDFMGGIFVPPGADDAEYRDYLDGDQVDDNVELAPSP